MIELLYNIIAAIKTVTNKVSAILPKNHIIELKQEITKKIKYKHKAGQNQTQHL